LGRSRSNRMRTAAKPDTPEQKVAERSIPGDCFVVVNSQGQCWDGAKWVALWCDAIQHRRPEHAYELCEAEAKAAEMVAGVAASVCYIPPGTPPFPLAPFPVLHDLRGLARNPDRC
jgi:hypothetical protein